MVNTNHNAISYVGQLGNSAPFRPLTHLSTFRTSAETHHTTFETLEVLQTRQRVACTWAVIYDMRDIKLS